MAAEREELARRAALYAQNAIDAYIADAKGVHDRVVRNELTSDEAGKQLVLAYARHIGRAFADGYNAALEGRKVRR